MKALGIVGSPVKGNTENLVREMVKKLGGGDIILLREKKILHCDGCLKCDKEGSCSLKDDMQEVYRKMESADVIVFGSPSYYDNVSGMMKMLIDRSVPYYMNKKLKGKKAVIITVGEESAAKAVPALKTMCDSNGIKIIGTIPVKAHSGKIAGRKSVEAKMDAIARKVRI
ncbi:MAG: flavodoxin family protein [Candidatus Aenigmarchaeota archaeon]|nr:flavodoxin family protein [Candidatus Aenigmarchaeota archaeon]